MNLRISDGDRVCIVGGGPAGSFAALHLHRLALRMGIRLEVLIFEPRDFSQPGPAGCNRCAGILSSRLLRGLDWLGLSLPPELIQATLHDYAIHLDDQVLRIEQPDPRRRIVSIYRGGGPRLLQGEPEASFDGYLLSHACARGARLVPARVRRVTWEGRPVVHTAQERYPADLLVLACGINSRVPLAPEYGYTPPKTAIMAQDEILRLPDWPQDQVRVYFPNLPGLLFGALIPKGQYVNISLLGQDLTRDAVSDFLDAYGLGGGPGAGSLSLCGCTPRIAVRPASGYFGQRWVAVGDAAVTRLYKDGVGSAFYTAQCAMQTAVQQGISRRAFQQTYLPFCRSIAADNLYGRMLFQMWSFILHTPRLLQAWTTIVHQETNEPSSRRIHIRILWGMFTGDEFYRDLFWLSLSPRALGGLARGWWSSR